MSINLVDYSDSSSEEEVEAQKSRKLPNPFGKLSKTEAQVEVCSTEHDGRVRTFAYERGNWPTYLYIHYPTTDLLIAFQAKILNLLKSSGMLEHIEFHPIDNFHMSLTRTVVLQHHWIDEFVRSVEQNLKRAKRFWMNLNSIQVYCNDNQTRTFISLAIAGKKSTAVQNLQHIANQLDGCLNEFKLPQFYKDASFHVSLLWCLGDRRNEIQNLLPEFDRLLQQHLSTDDSNFSLNVEQLFCKIGNKLYSFHL